MDFFMNPDDLPEHVKDELDKQAMQVDVIKHDIERLFDELDKDQLVTMRYLLSHSGGNEAYAAYMAGNIGAILKYKFGVCGCGKDHDKDLLDATGEVSVGSSPSIPDTVSQAATWDDTAAAKLDAEHWGVEFAAGYGPGYDMPVSCLGCGTESVSLTDRMLRPEGVKGCESCQIKAKWG